MGMSAGDLRHRVTLQSLVPIQDAVTGEITDTWVSLVSLWAHVRPSSVREFVGAGVEASKVTAAVKVRYRADIVPSMRILHGLRVYNIEGVLADPESGAEWLTLPVSEVVNG